MLTSTLSKNVRDKIGVISNYTTHTNLVCKLLLVV